MFKKNVGGADRILRIIAGVALIAAYFVFPSLSYGFVLPIIGVVLLGTAMISSCLLYTILGLRTAPKDD